jgi:hypothetical protein
MRTSDGYVVPIADETYMSGLAADIAAGGMFSGFVDTGGRVVPVGRVEWYAKLDGRAALRTVYVQSVTSDAEALPDPTGNPIFALFELLSAPEAGQQAEIATDRIVLPARLVSPGQRISAAAPSLKEAEKRAANVVKLQKESRKQLAEELKDKALPDLPGMASTTAIVAVVAVVVAIAALIYLRR